MQTIVVGQHVYTTLYSRGTGIVYAIHGEQSPGSGRSIGGGVVQMGGRAEFDIVFRGGCETRRLPECILRGVQWRILPEIATAEEIAALRANAATVQQQKADAAAAAAAERARAIEALRVNPAYSHLEQGDDQYSGKLAAANIRREIKRVFPGVKLSTRKDHYGSVIVRYPKGAGLWAEIRAITDKYQSAHFDGMQDLEELAAGPWHVVFGGAKYISVSEDWEG